MNESSMAIEIDGVSKKYGKYTVLDNLSLHVGYGEIYGFLGLNGAGKSTTIKMLLAMIRPNAGSLRMMNEKVDAGNVYCEYIVLGRLQDIAKLRYLITFICVILRRCIYIISE